eukprot:g7124.t1
MATVLDSHKATAVVLHTLGSQVLHRMRQHDVSHTQSAIAVALMIQRRQLMRHRTREESRANAAAGERVRAQFAPYVDTLPVGRDGLGSGLRNLPLFFGAHEKALLAGSTAGVVAAQAISEMTSPWSVLCGERKLEQPQVVAFCSTYTLEEFKWAMSIAASRAFNLDYLWRKATGGGQHQQERGITGNSSRSWPALVPLIDMVNHGEHPNAVYELDNSACPRGWREGMEESLSAAEPGADALLRRAHGDGAGARRAWQEIRAQQRRACAFVVLRAARDLAPGEELIVSYGAVDNVRSLVNYGFASLRWQAGSVVFAPRELGSGASLRLHYFPPATAPATRARAALYAQHRGDAGPWTGKPLTVALHWEKTMAQNGGPPARTQLQIVAKPDTERRVADDFYRMGRHLHASFAAKEVSLGMNHDGMVDSGLADAIKSVLTFLLHAGEGYHIADELVGPGTEAQAENRAETAAEAGPDNDGAAAAGAGAGAADWHGCAGAGVLPIDCSDSFHQWASRDLQPGFGWSVLCPEGCGRAHAAADHDGNSSTSAAASAGVTARVRGTGVFRSDSPICAAALHATGRDGGTFAIVRQELPLRDAAAQRDFRFEGSEAHGVHSWPASLPAVSIAVNVPPLPSATAYVVLASAQLGRKCRGASRHASLPCASHSAGALRQLRRWVANTRRAYAGSGDPAADERLLHFGDAEDPAQRVPRWKWWFLGYGARRDGGWRALRPIVSMLRWWPATRGAAAASRVEDAAEAKSGAEAEAPGGRRRMDYVHKSIVITRWSEKHMLAHIDEMAAIGLRVHAGDP